MSGFLIGCRVVMSFKCIFSPFFLLCLNDKGKSIYGRF